MKNVINQKTMQKNVIFSKWAEKTMKQWHKTLHQCLISDSYGASELFQQKLLERQQQDMTF